MDKWIPIKFTLEKTSVGRWRRMPACTLPKEGQKIIVTKVSQSWSPPYDYNYWTEEREYGVTMDRDDLMLCVAWMDAPEPYIPEKEAT